MADMPAGTTYGIITGNLTEFVADGPDDPIRRALIGSVTFKPQIPSPGYLIDQRDGGLIYGKPVTVELDSNGSFSVILVATDCAELNRSGWKYVMTVITSDGVITQQISVPGGTSTSLSQLLSGVPGTQVTTPSATPPATTTTSDSTLTLVPSGDNSTFALSGTNAVDNGKDRKSVV